jgi:hypothetical protein
MDIAGISQSSIFPIEYLQNHHYTKQGLSDSTACTVYTVGKGLLSMFAAAFSLKWIANITVLLQLLIQDPLTEICHH